MQEKEVTLKSNQAVSLDLKFANEINIKTWDKQKLFQHELKVYVCEGSCTENNRREIKPRRH